MEISMKMDLGSFKHTMVHYSAILSLFFCLMLPALTEGYEILPADKQIVLGTQKPQESPAGTYLYLVYSEAFKRLGKVFVYQTYPAKRSSLLSDNGTLDGELSRIYSYNEIHPHVIRIEEPHWTSGFIAVSTMDSIQLDGWDSLKNTDYKVIYMAGIKGCEVNLPKVVKSQNLEAVMQPAHGFRMVLKGRADLFIASEMDMIDLMESEEFRDTPLRVVGVMQRFTAHAFLHKRHQELVPELSKVLSDMKKEKLFERFKTVAKLKTYLND